MTSPSPAAYPDGAGLVAAYARSRHTGVIDTGAIDTVEAVDELVDQDGRPQPAARDLAATIDLLGLGGLLARRAELARLVEDEGVTYGGTHGRWRVDPLPLVLGHAEWARLEAALAQRADLLDHVLADLTGPRTLLRRGVVPPEVVLAHSGFLRAGDQVVGGPRPRLVLQAVDLARDRDGAWAVLGDRTQAPSGAGYAMQTRRVTSRVMPGLYRDTRLERLRTFFHTVRAALQEAAPATAEAPRVVLLSPGPESETAFDQSFLSTLLGYPLVEGEDLTVQGGRVFQRSLGRRDDVDVVLRRVDAAWTDPLELRPDSQLGVPGLLEATRQGTVALVNPVSAGVLENPGLLPYLPAVCQALLGSDLLLPSAPTWWCGDPTSLAHVLARLDTLVVKPIAREVGRASMFAGQLSRAQREDLARRIQAEPHGWCAQDPLELSTAPVVTTTGLQSRHLVLRTFAVSQGGRQHLMAGGLARVSGGPGQRLVSGAAGSLAKDVWVLSADDADVRAGVEPGQRDVVALALLPSGSEALPAIPPRVAENLFWLGRYAERAEGTARLLRVLDDLAEDYTARPGTAGARSLELMLRAVTHFTENYPGFLADRPPGASPRAELVALAVDSEREGTLAHAVRRAAWAAHAVRDQLSTDTWTVLGSLDRVLAGLTDRTAASTGDVPMQPALARTLEGLLALAGLGAESMVRDTGWYLMDAGRRLERGLLMLRLLRHTITEQRSVGVEQLVLESVLTAGESIITHRRRHPGRADVSSVLDLLVFDRSNPRSVTHQLDRLADDLSRVPQAPGGRSTTLLRRTTAQLREATPDGTDREALAALLDTLYAGLAGVGEALAAEHFVHAAPRRAFGIPMAQQVWGPA